MLAAIANWPRPTRVGASRLDLKDIDRAEAALQAATG
jgi:hypothetical protein